MAILFGSAGQGGGSGNVASGGFCGSRLME
jgi:hypothetical protein